MSNEQVILEMVINRLDQLLEGSQELKAKWSAEITEIILLGKGVLVAPTGGYRQDGKWLLELDNNQLDMLSNMFWQDNMDRRDFGREIWESMAQRIGVLFEQMCERAQDETLNDDPDGDDDGQ
jgi:hypothetical protein